MPGGLVPSADEEKAIAQYIQGAWAAFAKDPHSGLSHYDGGWPQFGTEAPSLIRLAFNNQTGTNLVKGGEYDSLCTGIPVVKSPDNRE